MNSGKLISESDVSSLRHGRREMIFCRRITSGIANGPPMSPARWQIAERLYRYPAT